MSTDAPPQKDAITLKNSDVTEMSKNERIKLESQGLFFVAEAKQTHSFREELEALSGDQETIGGTAKELSKFFGIYKQQARGERGKKTQDFFFMVRIANPGGGELTPAQWIALDEAADQFADGTLRITSRQGIQYHRVYGKDLAPLVRHLNRGYKDHGTLGACGDVNRNVMGSPADTLHPDHAPRGLELAREIASELAPKSSSYFQIFLSDAEGGNKTPVNPEEPLYGKQYLPRKFKIGIGHPADNAADILTQDVGLMPVDSDGAEWDLYSGGGLGLSHNNPATAAYAGLYLGRVARGQVVDAVRGIVTLQKENGERKNRKQARWKYTIRRMGLDAVRKELTDRFGIALADADPIPLPDLDLYLGWHEGRQGGFYGLSVENGRLKGAQRKAVREAVETLDCSVVLTGHHDLILCGVPDAASVEAILERHGARAPAQVSAARAHAMACPAKPTCGLAMTDAENILPSYLDAIEAEGLGDLDVVIRMTGCPNNCARPPSAEIGIYGYGKNDHVVLVGGARNGSRLAHVLYERIPGEQMIPALVGLYRAIKERNPEGLPPGEFLHRTDPAELRSWIGLDLDASA